MAGAAATGSIPAGLHAGHGVGQLAGLHAVNMFLARVGFDLLRSQRFYDSLRQRLTTRLANINVPNYITPLRLDGMELGTTTPMLKAAYSLPSPGRVLVPRLVMDIVYHGTFKLIIHTSINMKDSAAALTSADAYDLAAASAGACSGVGASGHSPDASPPPLDVGMLDAAALKALQEGFDTLTGGAAADLSAPSSRLGKDASGALSPPSESSACAGDGGKPGRKVGLAVRGYRSIKNIMSGGAPAPAHGSVCSATCLQRFPGVHGPCMRMRVTWSFELVLSAQRCCMPACSRFGQHLHAHSVHPDASKHQALHCRCEACDGVHCRVCVKDVCDTGSAPCTVL
jgi:hypothetical protein